MKTFIQYLNENADFGRFLQQFLAPPYHADPRHIQALIQNPWDHQALNALSSRDMYVGNMIRQYLHSGGENQTHDDYSSW